MARPGSATTTAQGGWSGPAAWPPPRGRRDQAGRWRYTLQSRPLSDCSSAVERGILDVWRQVVRALTYARYSLGLSIRDIATRTGMSPSTISGLEQGDHWPTLPTTRTLAHAVGVQVLVAGDPDAATGLQRALKASRRTRHTLALMGGVRPNTITDLLAGRDHPSMATVLAVAAALGVTVTITPGVTRPSPARVGHS